MKDKDQHKDGSSTDALLDRIHKMQNRQLAKPAQIEDVNDVRQRSLMPVHHPNRDFFLCDLFDYALKEDNVTMEVPLFSLSTKPDLKIWKWQDRDGNRSIEITPSILGRATIFDNNVLIYVISQLTAGLNQGREDAKSRIVQFVVYDYLVATNQQTGGREYNRLQEALDRLKGTNIKTNIKTGGVAVREGFGLIDRWKIIEKSPDDERMIAVEIELSKWFFNAVQAREVLTISPDYFRLRKPIERRLYLIARKHCGQQEKFLISLPLLLQKTGSTSAINEFRRILRAIADDNLLPEYLVSYNREKDMVTFYNRNHIRKIADAVDVVD